MAEVPLNLLLSLPNSAYGKYVGGSLISPTKNWVSTLNGLSEWIHTDSGVKMFVPAQLEETKLFFHKMELTDAVQIQLGFIVQVINNLLHTGMEGYLTKPQTASGGFASRIIRGKQLCFAVHAEVHNTANLINNSVDAPVMHFSRISRFREVFSSDSIIKASQENIKLVNSNV